MNLFFDVFLTEKLKKLITGSFNFRCHILLQIVIWLGFFLYIFHVVIRLNAVKLQQNVNVFQTEISVGKIVSSPQMGMSVRRGGELREELHTILVL